MFRRLFVVSTALLLLGGCVSTTTMRDGGRTPPGLPAKAIAGLNAAMIPADAVGAIAIRLSDGATLLSHRPEASLQPASTLKLVTSIVALERLGPTYRGRAELRSKGEIKDGVLKGDMVLRGMGDADLDWEALQRMLQTLRHKGISQIDGDLILDRQWFQPPRPDLGLPPFDETPEFRYNVIPDALTLNTNLLQLDMESGEREKVTGMGVNISPKLDGVTIVSNMTLVDRVCADWEDGWKLPLVSRGNDGAIRIQLQGEFPRSCSASTSINVLDRIEFADRLFRPLWRNMGGTFRGQTRDSTAADPASADTRLLTHHQSRTLAEVTRDINKKSDNTVTRMTYLNMGALATNETALTTAARAERQVRAWFKRKGIDDTGMVLDNGSGLSRSERIRPAQLASVLKAAHASDWAPEFIASMPIAAIDGGMQKRLHDSPAAGRARIKTGTLRDVSAVAGFVPDAANRLCIVVVMINHPLAKDGAAHPILDAVIDWVARSGKQ